MHACCFSPHRPVDEETLRNFLAARGVTVAPGEDFTVTTSTLLADIFADAVARRPAACPNPAEQQPQMEVFAMAVAAMRANPFKHLANQPNPPNPPTSTD